MQEEILREVLQAKAEARTRNEETEDRRKREIREQNPEIAKLMAERENLIAGTMRGILRGAQTPEDLKNRVDEVSGKIRKALMDAGYPEDYLAPVYDCKVCQDRGVVGDNVRDWCECVRKMYQEKTREKIGLKGNQETFERFDLSVFPDEKFPGTDISQRSEMAVVRKTLEGWADRYPENSKRDIVLSGPSGTGKTFLLNAIAQRLIERDVQVLPISAYKFLEIARKSYFENDGRLEELTGVKVLLLDDLGSEPMMQNVTIEQLFNLIDERQRKGLSTVISTNLNEKDLKERYTERIVSRITDRKKCYFLPIEGVDIRRT